LKALQQSRAAQSRLTAYRPYTRQREFHGQDKRQRLLLGGNQTGKTMAGGAEAAFHATGEYPEWWTGRRWDRATVGWASGPTGETTRDNAQRILLGRPGDYGTGWIPKRALLEVVSARGIANAVDYIRVAHVSGGQSFIKFKSYDQGREKWQGETIDWLWCDEEPPEDIYGEGLTRTNATGGYVWLTATPLLGMTRIIERFYPVPTSDDCGLTVLTIEDAEHYSPEERARIVANYPPSEAKTRATGIPYVPGGRVYTNFDRSQNVAGVKDHGGDLVVGMDFNVAPMSAIIGVRAGDQLHVFDEIELTDSGTEEMAREIKSRYPGRRVTVFPDPSGNSRRTSAPAGQTDFAILRGYRFDVIAPSAPPPIPDRVNSVQRLLRGPDGVRRLFIAPKCGRLIKCLEMQTYKVGTSQPDKANGYDHMNDALGYLVYSEFPIISREVVVRKVTGY
jgi:phage terminase large subunit-like protein